MLFCFVFFVFFVFSLNFRLFFMTYLNFVSGFFLFIKTKELLSDDISSENILLKVWKCSVRYGVYEGTYLWLKRCTTLWLYEYWISFAFFRRLLIWSIIFAHKRLLFATVFMKIQKKINFIFRVLSTRSPVLETKQNENLRTIWGTDGFAEEFLNKKWDLEFLGNILVVIWILLNSLWEFVVVIRIIFILSVLSVKTNKDHQFPFQRKKERNNPQMRI